MSGRRGKESNLLLTRKIIVPRKFSKLISSHGSAISAENGVKSITPHQILNPDFNPVSPKLRVEIPDSSTNSDFNSSASQQYQQTGPNTESFTQKLPARKPFIARALRKQASAELEFEDQSEIDSLPSGRKTILELEAQLIQERQQLKQLQLEAVTKKKVYAKTTRQMQARLIENQQRAKMLLDAVKQARTGLEKLEAEQKKMIKKSGLTILR